MKLVVLKFGGTSVADVPQIKKIALKVRNEVISRLLQLNHDLSKLEIRSNNFEPKKVSKSKSDSIGQYQIGLEF